MKLKSLLLLMATGVMLAFTGCDSEDSGTDDSATADDSGAYAAVTLN